MNIQTRTQRWLIACFGPKAATDKVRRNQRFLEEALELVQACGTSKEEALQLIDYVYDREKGEVPQEVGGVMTTLAGLCTAQGVDMEEAAHIELDRCWTKVEKIRAKEAAKPEFRASS